MTPTSLRSSAGAAIGVRLPPGRRRLGVTHTSVLLGLLVFLLAAGRWGAYVRVPGTPLYSTDLVLAACISLLLYAASRAPLRVLGTRFAAAVAALVVYGVLRLLAGGDVSVTALRDASPLLYALAYLIATCPTARTGSAELAARIDRAARHGLAAYVVLAAIESVTHISDRLPSVAEKVHMFSLGRTDFSAAVLAAAAVTFGLDASRGRHTRSAVPLATVAVILVATSGNRAGFVALVVSSVITIKAAPHHVRQRQRRSARPILATVGLVSIVLATAAMSPSFRTDTVERFANIFVSGGDEGTEAARSTVWGKVIAEGSSSPGRFLFGSGFGTDFLDEAGVLEVYEGTTYEGVREAHNVLVTVYARAGVIGLVLYGFVLVVGVLRLRRVTLHAPLALAASLATAGMLGVIIEPPFGAVTFFVALAAGSGGVVAGRASPPHPEDPASLVQQSAARRARAVPWHRTRRDTTAPSQRR